MEKKLLVVDDAMIIREMIKDAAIEDGWEIVGEATTQKPRVSAQVLRGTYPADKQAALNRTISESIGFDYDAGRIDTSVHPFAALWVHATSG